MVSYNLEDIRLDVFAYQLAEADDRVTEPMVRAIAHGVGLPINGGRFDALLFMAKCVTLLQDRGERYLPYWDGSAPPKRGAAEAAGTTPKPRRNRKGVAGC